MITVLRTERLTLEPFTLAHSVPFFELTQDVGFNAFPITLYRQTSLDSSREWIQEAMSLREKTGLGKMGIFEVRTGDLIGMAGLTPWTWEGEDLIDLTYRIRRSSWGLGYGSEAALALTQCAFGTLRLEEITATMTPDNLPSIKVASRLKMQFEKRIVLKNVQTDLYRLSRQEFSKMK